jgi:hypothetical protein
VNVHDDLVLVCSCSSLGHVVRFSRWSWECSSGGETQHFEAYVDVALDARDPLWSRIKAAIRHVLGRTCAYGIAAEVIVSEGDLPKLREWIVRCEADVAAREEAHRGGRTCP